MITPPSTTRRGPYAKTAQRREEIVAAAIREFSVRGYHGGSLRQIARELGLSVTSVTHVFGSKAELLEAVLNRTDVIGSEFLDPYRADGVAVGVLALVRRNQRYPELLRLLAVISAEASAPDHPAHDWFVARYERLISVLEIWFEEDRTRGLFDVDRDARAIAERTVAVWDGVQLQWLIDPRRDVELVMRAYFAANVPEGLPQHDT